MAPVGRMLDRIGAIGDKIDYFISILEYLSCYYADRMLERMTDLKKTRKVFLKK